MGDSDTDDAELGLTDMPFRDAQSDSVTRSGEFVHFRSPRSAQLARDRETCKLKYCNNLACWQVYCNEHPSPQREAYERSSILPPDYYQWRPWERVLKPESSEPNVHAQVEAIVREQEEKRPREDVVNVEGTAKQNIVLQRTKAQFVPARHQTFIHTHNHIESNSQQA